MLSKIPFQILKIFKVQRMLTSDINIIVNLRGEKMIKAVFFDWGRTLISGFKENDAKIEEILKPYGLKWSEVFKIWRNFYLLRSLGRLKTDQEMFEQLRKILDLPSEKPLESIRDLVIDSHIIAPETIDIIKKIKNYYKVGIISNNVYDWVIRVLDNYRIRDLFDAIVISSEIGARKPDARIFVAALKALSIKPEEAVFVSDELAEDLAGAKGLGMITVWLKNPHIKSEWTRYEKPEEKIFEPDATISNLKELLMFLEIQ
jgi:FMN phosphatase YigB (HAD superfamily)